MTTAALVESKTARWVAGSHWMSFADKPSPTELKALARTQQAAWVVLRHTALMSQVGFVALPRFSGSRKQPVYSLAAGVSTMHRAPWRGVFALDDGRYWYVAVREGGLIPVDGDVVGTLEDVQHCMAAQETYDAWTDVPDITPIVEVKTWLDEGAPVKIPVVSTQTSRWYVAGGISVLVLLAVGASSAWLWHLHKLHVAQAQAQAARFSREIGRMRHPTNATNDEKDRGGSAPGLPALQFAAQCAQQVHPVALVRGTQRLVKVECGPAGVTLTWEQGGVMTWPNGAPAPTTTSVQTEQHVAYTQAEAVSEKPAGSAASAPAGAPSGCVTWTALWSGWGYAQDQVDNATQYSLRLTTQQDAVPVSASQAIAQVSAQAAVRARRDATLYQRSGRLVSRGARQVGRVVEAGFTPQAFTVTQGVSPWELEPALRTVSGVTLESATWTAQSGWTYTGTCDQSTTPP